MQSAIQEFADKLTYYTALYLSGFVFLIGAVQIPFRGGMFGQIGVVNELMGLIGVTAATFFAVWAAGAVAWWTLQRRLKKPGR